MDSADMLAKKRGRPPGSDETPERLIRAELLAQLKLYRRIREIVEARVSAAGDGMPPEELGKLMDLLRRGIGDMARAIAPASAPSAKAAAAEEDPDALLERMLGGGRE